MVIFHPTQSLFEHARDLESLGLHLEAVYWVGFWLCLILCVCNRVMVPHLCGTRCMDHFASVIVDVGMRQTPLLQWLPSSLSIKKWQLHTHQYLILAFHCFNDYIDVKANMNGTWKLTIWGNGKVEGRACVNQLQLRGFVGNINFCCYPSEHLCVLLLTLHTMLKSRTLCCFTVPRNSILISALDSLVFSSGF